MAHRRAYTVALSSHPVHGLQEPTFGRPLPAIPQEKQRLLPSTPRNSSSSSVRPHDFGLFMGNDSLAQPRNAQRAGFANDSSDADGRYGFIHFDSASDPLDAGIHSNGSHSDADSGYAPMSERRKRSNTQTAVAEYDEEPPHAGNGRLPRRWTRHKFVPATRANAKIVVSRLFRRHSASAIPHNVPHRPEGDDPSYDGWQYPWRSVPADKKHERVGRWNNEVESYHPSRESSVSAVSRRRTD